MKEPILINDWAYSTPNEDGNVEAFFKVDDKEYKILITHKDVKTMSRWQEMHKMENS